MTVRQKIISSATCLFYQSDSFPLKPETKLPLISEVDCTQMILNHKISNT